MLYFNKQVPIYLFICYFHPLFYSIILIPSNLILEKQKETQGQFSPLHQKGCFHIWFIEGLACKCDLLLNLQSLKWIGLIWMMNFMPKKLFFNLLFLLRPQESAEQCT